MLRVARELHGLLFGCSLNCTAAVKLLSTRQSLSLPLNSLTIPLFPLSTDWKGVSFGTIDSTITSRGRRLKIHT